MLLYFSCCHDNKHRLLVLWSYATVMCPINVIIRTAYEMVVPLANGKAHFFMLALLLAAPCYQNERRRGMFVAFPVVGKWWLRVKNDARWRRVMKRRNLLSFSLFIRILTIVSLRLGTDRMQQCSAMWCVFPLTAFGRYRIITPVPGGISTSLNSPYSSRLGNASFYAFLKQLNSSSAAMILFPLAWCN